MENDKKENSDLILFYHNRIKHKITLKLQINIYNFLLNFLIYYCLETNNIYFSK